MLTPPVSFRTGNMPRSPKSSDIPSSELMEMQMELMQMVMVMKPMLIVM